jgi:glycosyltransferase involved in cell wall biosynthesis
MPRLLFITTGIFFVPDSAPIRAKFLALGAAHTGDVLSVAHKRAFRRAEIGAFRVRSIYLPYRVRESGVLRFACFASFVLCRTLWESWARRRPYDAVVVSDPVKLGVVAWIAARLTGAKLIVDLVGNLSKSVRFGSERLSAAQRLRHRVNNRVAPFILRRADAVKLLYDGQVAQWDLPADRLFRFHDFVPLGEFHAGDGDEGYLLLVGYPWFLKGVDLLIQAFNRICEAFPKATLRIVGYCEDRAPFERLAAGNPRIAFFKPVHYEAIPALMAGCTAFVLPSRTEAMGRVLLEAMASRKAIVASRVDGIPTYVHDGENGLLFEPESIDGLAEALRRILGDPALRERLAANGYREVHENLSEARYVEGVSRMVAFALGEPRADTVAAGSGPA